MLEKTKIVVFVSGGGTNLQAIIDAAKSGLIKSGEIVGVVSSSPTAYAIERAKKEGIPYTVVSLKECSSRAEFEEKILESTEKYGAELIVLAGFMSILSAEFISRYRDRIINVHPSLIPSFCGKGYYGLNVHKAALEYGVKVTGATVHYVNEIPDGGKIIDQKSVRISPSDTPESLQKKVMQKCEWIILPRACEKISAMIAKSKKGNIAK